MIMILLLCLSVCFIHASDRAKLAKIGFDILTPQKLLLYEKNTASPSSFKWVDGINIKTVCAVARVNRECYNFISTVRNTIQQLVLEKSDPQACPSIDSKTVVCNSDGFWIAIGTQKDFPYNSYNRSKKLFFGNETSFWRENLLGDMSMIRSLERADKKPVFCVTKGKSNNLIEPSSGEVWDIKCNNMWKSYGEDITIHDLQETVSHIINIPFWLDVYCTKLESGSYQRDEIIAPNPVTIVKNSGTVPTSVLYSVNMQSPLFPATWWNNYKKLSNASIDLCNDYCTCTTNVIDPRCTLKYEELSAIAEQESAFAFKKKIQMDFACRHVLHEIQNNFSSDLTIYSNPFGEILISGNQLDKNGVRHFYIINNSNVTGVNIQEKDEEPYFVTWAQSAQQNAATWFEKDGLLFAQKVDSDRIGKNLYLVNLFQVKKANAGYNVRTILEVNVESNFEIIDSYAKQNKDYSIYV